MKRGALAAVLALAPACASLPPLSPFDSEDSRPERSLELSIGQRAYQSDQDWPGIEQQPVAGLSLGWRRPEQPLAWELGLSYAEARDEVPPPGGALEGRVGEFSAGLRYEFAPLRRTFLPYVGGGLSLLYAWREVEPFGFPATDDDDLDWGAYAHAGIRAEFYEGVYLGVDLRVLSEDWTGGGRYDLDYGQAAVTIGSLF